MSRPKPPEPISRRAALGALGALGVAGAACRGWQPPEGEATSRAIAKPYVPGAERYGTHEERWIQSSCGQCQAGCGIQVRVVEGRAVRIEGNRDNPLNHGGIGPRGLAALQSLYDADRLTGPLRRVGGALVPIGWDEAIAVLADALAALRDQGQADRLLVWCGLERGPLHDLLARFCQAYGTPNFVDGRAGRSAPLAQAMAATTGGPAEIPTYGWEHASYVLSLEAGLLEDSCQAVYFTRVAAELHRASGRRTRLVHAGARLDLCAYNADEWVRIRPGTGGALALGLAHILLERYPEHTALPDDLTAGAAGFRALVGRYPPARVAALTGARVDTMQRLVTELWTQRPSLVVVDEGSLGYSNGLDTARAALALNALLGGFWASAGGVRPAVTAPLRDWPALVLDAAARAGLARPRLDGATAIAHATGIHEALPEAIAAAGDRAPAIALLHHANPVYARQQPARWRRALEAIPLVVSFSPFRDETVDEVADLVLPDHTFLERWEITTPAPALDRAIVGVRAPAVEPLHDTRPTADVVLALAQRLGGTVAAGLAWTSFREALEERLVGLFESEHGSLAARTFPEFLRALARTGHWVEAPPAAPAPVRVALPDTYQEPIWYGDPDRYPLGLVVHRPLGYAEGSGANLPWLRNLRPRAGMRAWSFAARVHPQSAPGLADGDVVTLSSEWGSIQLEVALDEALMPGYVVVPMGGGHTAFGRWARGWGANVMTVLRPGPALDSGAGVRNATRVRIERAPGGAS